MHLTSDHVHRLMIQHAPILGNAKCGVCKGDISEPYCFYKCDSCIYRYAVHERCHQIDHPFHPSHPLILHTDDRDSFICNSCHKMHTPTPFIDELGDNAYYACAECDFYMDVKCARMPLVTCDDMDQEHIQHFTHQHPMPLINPITWDGFNRKNKCCACRLPCSGSEAYYGCERCEYFLHKSCAQLPQQIHGASVHKEHPLTLHIANREFLTCTLCKKSHFFSFECGQCSINFCVNCTTLTQAVMFEYHEHPLYFHERLHYNDLVDQCDSYDSYCKNPITRGTEEFNHTKSSMLGCVQCNFKLHLLCGPLPSTIKYEYHIHSLLLVDSIGENDYGEYCCAICEMERDPRLCAYFCEHCKFVAHVHCLSSEIIKALKGDVKDMKLKTVGNDLWKFSEEINDNVRVEETEQSISLTLRDLILKLSVGERLCLGERFYWDEDQKEMSTRTTQVEHEDKTIDEALQFSTFSETEFISFIFNEFENSYYRRKLKIESSDLSLKLVKFKDYFVPLNLVSVFKTLLHKYGDIAGKSSRSQDFNSMRCFFICKVMKEMHTTLVIDITKDLLQHWYYYIKFADDWNSKMGFLEASLEEITRDFFYLQLSQVLEVEIPTIMNKRMIELQKKMENTQKKMANYEKFCESTSKKEIMKEGLNKVMQLKWRTAGKVGNLHLI